MFLSSLLTTACWFFIRERTEKPQKKEKRREIKKKRENKTPPGLPPTQPVPPFARVAGLCLLSHRVVVSIHRTRSPVCVLSCVLVLAYVCSLLDHMPCLHPWNVPMTVDDQRYREPDKGTDHGRSRLLPKPYPGRQRDESVCVCVPTLQMRRLGLREVKTLFKVTRLEPD